MANKNFSRQTIAVPCGRFADRQTRTLLARVGERRGPGRSLQRLRRKLMILEDDEGRMCRSLARFQDLAIDLVAV
jgi:hypothetical protein